MGAVTLRGSNKSKVNVQSSWDYSPVAEYLSPFEYHSAFDDINHVFADSRNGSSMMERQGVIVMFQDGDCG